MADPRAAQPPQVAFRRRPRFLDTAQEELDQLEEDPSSIEGDPFPETTKLAEGLGLQTCAQGG